MSLGILSVDLIAKLAQFESGMTRAGRIAEKAAHDIQARWDGLAGAAKGVAGAFGAAFSATAMVAFARQTINGIDNLNDLADATGSTVENLSALEDAAVRTGSDVEGMSTALVKLNMALSAAIDPDSDAARALKAIGLEAAELRKLDPVDALVAISRALAGFADDANKARLVQELFGKSLREVAPLLKELAQYGKPGGTITTEQAQQAEDFNKAIASLGKNATDAARAITSDLLPAVNGFLARVGRKGFFGAIGEQFTEELLVGRLTATGEEIEAMLPSVRRAQAILEKAPTNPYAKQTLADFDALKAKAVELRAELLKVRGVTEVSPRDALRAMEAGVSAPLGTLPELGKKGKAPKSDKKELPSVLSADFSNALRALEQTDEAKLASLSRTLDELFKMRESGVFGPEVDAAIEATRDAYAKLLSPVQKLTAMTVELDPATQRALSAIGSSNSARLAELRDTLQALERLRDSGLYGPEVDEAIENTRNELASLGQPVSQLSLFAEEAARNIQDAFGDTLVKALEGDFESIGQMWSALLKRMAAQALAAQLNEYLFGADGKGGALKSLFQFIGGVIGGATGGTPSGASWNPPVRAAAGAVFDGAGLVTSPTTFRFAAGGVVRRGLMGEAGAEAIMPLARDSRGRLGVRGGGGGGFTYAPTVNFNGSGLDAGTVEAMLARERVRFQRMIAAT